MLIATILQQAWKHSAATGRVSSKI